MNDAITRINAAIEANGQAALSEINEMTFCILNDRNLKIEQRLKLSICGFEKTRPNLGTKDETPAYATLRRLEEYTEFAFQVGRYCDVALYTDVIKVINERFPLRTELEKLTYSFDGRRRMRELLDEKGIE